ncbi:unnamed protein product [Gordionus sp. m RMFG-2023]
MYLSVLSLPIHSQFPVMCISLIYYEPSKTKSNYIFIFAHNRDEYFDRPSKPISMYSNSDIISGIDTTIDKEGGTWLGISKKNGKIATILNIPTKRKPNIYINLPEILNKNTKRGFIVNDFLADVDPDKNSIMKCEKLFNEKYYNQPFHLIGTSSFPYKINSLNFKQQNSDTSYYSGLYYYNNETHMKHSKFINLMPDIYCFGNSKYPETSLLKNKSNSKPKWSKLLRAKKIFEKILFNDYDITTNFGNKDQILASLMNELLLDHLKYTYI